MVRSYFPIPSNVTDCGLPPPLLATFRLAVRMPVAVGLNATLTVQLDPPPSVDEKWIQIRGGSFQTPLASAVASSFVAIPERYTAPDIGFRCAKTP